MGIIFNFKYPFIYFNEYGVKLALIILIVFCIESVIILIFGKCNNEISFEINLKSMSLGEKNRLIKYAIIYIMLIGAYYFKNIANITSNNPKSIFIEVSENYLIYETAISIILVLVNLFSYFLISKNKDTFYNLLYKVVAVILYLSVFATLITKQIDLFKFNNFICYISLGFIFIILLVCKVNPFPLKDVGSNIFQAVESYNDLFPSHQSQAVELINNIKHSTSISICIAGEWGSGKTSLVNGALNELISEGKNEYEIIRVNALEIDTTQSLFLYVFSRIKQCLKNRGVYAGIGSEYESFISASMGVITNDTFGSLISKRFFSMPTDYRNQKISLEEVIYKSLGNDKIIVIVDDIERCNSQKAIEFVFLIKEIATMQNCVAIFITDYEQLIRSELIIKKDNYKFFEKFFNYKINLINVPLCESMSFYENSIYFKKISSYREFKKPSVVFEDLSIRLNMRIHKQLQEFDDKEKAAKLSKQFQNFEGLLQHPRNIVKFYHMYSNFCSTINLKFEDTKELEIVTAYFNKIEISKVIFILSYIQACLPTEFEQIQSKGINRYIESLNNTNEEDENKLLIIALCENILFTKSISISLSYQQMDVLKFIDALLIYNTDMISLVNGFTSQEEEWFDLINNNRIDEIKAIWAIIFDAILRKFSYSNNETGEKYIHKLFEFAINEIKCKKIDINDIYKIFSPSIRSERWFTYNLYIMKEFYCNFCKTEFLKYLSDESIDNIDKFSIQYIPYRFEVINKLTAYLINDREREILDRARDCLHNVTDNIENRIILYIAEIYSIDYLSDKTVKGKNVFDYLDNLYILLSSFMEESKLSVYPDVQKDLLSMKLSIEDLKFFAKLIMNSKHLPNRNSFNRADINKENLTDTIRYFQDRFSSKTDTKLWDEFKDFFEYIKYEKGLRITSSQLVVLHELITSYIIESGHETMYYRKVLLDYANLNHIELDN